ncbi:MAG: hypothetical protein V4690_03305 [Patescibacteria group bacterium]
MTPEERELLQRSVDLAEENNGMLRTIRRSMRIARIMSILYWVVIIGSAIGAYYFIQPYLEFMTGAYGDAKDSVGGGINSINELMEMLKNLGQ